MRVRLATADDADPLRDLAARTAMHGRLRLARPATLGPWKETVVAESGGRLVACGQRVRRHRYVNGNLVPTAYLTSLRVAPEARGDGRLILRGYGLLRELHEQAGRPPTFTSIMADNAAALSLFDRPRRGLPRYEFIGPYLTALARGRAFRNVPPAERTESPPQFAAPRGPGITRSLPPFTLVGFGGALRPLDALLPRKGVTIGTSCLWQKRRESANPGCGLRPRRRYLVGGAPGDPFLAALARRRGVRLLHSRLFAVRWPGDAWKLDGRPVSPEVADL